MSLTIPARSTMVFILLLASLEACGTDPTGQPDGGGGGTDADIPLNEGECGPPVTAAVVTSDFSTGGAALLDLDERTVRADLVTLFPDSVVSCHCGIVLVVERLGGDNLTLLDPTNLSPIAQFSLGRRTNPQGVWLEGSDAFVSLHETGEVLRLDVETGEVLDRADLGPLADADGQPEPAALMVHQDRLFVLLQHLNRNSALWDPAGTAEVAVVDSDTLDIESSFQLLGRNPVTQFVPHPDTGVVLVGHAGFWTDSEDGGIERIDLLAGESDGWVITSDELGGNVQDFVILRRDLGYALVNVPNDADRLVSFDPESGRRTGELATAPTFTLTRIVHDPHREQLLVVSRDPASPGVRIFDVSTNRELTDAPLPTGLPPTDLCLVPDTFVEVEADGDGDADADADADSDGDMSAERTGQFAGAVEDYQPAAGATFGADQLPDVVLGPPEGGGEHVGSLDVVSLGCGGSIVLRFDPPIRNRPDGPDFLVFENPVVTSAGGVFAEPGLVGVSSDGVTFVDFPCAPEESPPEGCAGVAPVLSNGSNLFDPTDPAAAGGDPYDLEDLGLSEVSYVRIIDRSDASPEASVWCGGASAGFDLDAVSVIGSGGPS